MPEHQHSMILSSVAEIEPLRDAFAAAMGMDIPQMTGLVGFDGFIDTFVTPQAPSSMAAFGPKVASAAGIATSFPAIHGGDHFGGNGPLLTLGLHALLQERASLHYIGSVGAGQVHPLFAAGFDGKLASLHAVAAPARSTCLEFADGKVMLSDMTNCADIRWDRILATVGEGELDRLLRELDFIAAVNWGKLPHAGEVWRELVRRLRAVGVPQKKVTLFMDLAEFEHRPDADLAQLFADLAELTAQCRTILSLNLKEAWQLGRVLGHDFHGHRSVDSVVRLTALLQQSLEVDRVVVHPNDGAACCSSNGVSYVPGPLCSKPLRSTGAGDHFGAGCLAAAALGLDDPLLLLAGVCSSGFFVRTGRSPSAADLLILLDRWLAGRKGVGPWILV